MKEGRQQPGTPSVRKRFARQRSASLKTAAT
jgi:hypothetical protein